MHEVRRDLRCDAVPDRRILVAQSSFNSSPQLIETVVLAAVGSAAAVTDHDRRADDHKRDAAVGDQPLCDPLGPGVGRWLVTRRRLGVKALRNSLRPVAGAIGRGQIDEALNTPGPCRLQELGGQVNVGALKAGLVEIVHAACTMNDLVHTHGGGDLVEVAETLDRRQGDHCHQPHELLYEVLRDSAVAESEPYPC